jgi:cellulose synthase/poly-beta-1,6-N-acetylglucosamine synthase-like glycosyltransferase
MSQEFSMQLDPAFLSGGRRLKCLVAEDGAKACTEMPLVTVVTAAFNGQQFMAACLESVLRQDYPNIEHLVLDGGMIELHCGRASQTKASMTHGTKACKKRAANGFVFSERTMSFCLGL